MPIDFTQPIEKTNAEEAVFLGTEDSIFPTVDFWYNISVFTEADVDPGVDTGWDIIQVDERGYLRAEVEAETLTTPVIQNVVTSETVTLFFYPDGAIHSVQGDPDFAEAPDGYYGSVEIELSTLTYEDGSITLTSASLGEVISPV